MSSLAAASRPTGADATAATATADNNDNSAVCGRGVHVSNTPRCHVSAACL